MVFKTGEYLKIIDAGLGAYGCNRENGIVIDNSYLNYNTDHGLFESDEHFKILLDNGEMWRVSLHGKYELL